MRLTCIGLIAASVLASAAAGNAQPAQPEISGRVVVGVTGGLLGKQTRSIVDTFLKPYGAQAVYLEGNAGDLLAKVRAQKSNPQIDVFFGNDQTFATARQLGLSAKLDPKLVPNLAQLQPTYRDPDGYGQFYAVNPVGICYRPDKFAAAGIPAPTSWDDFADSRLKGKVTVFPPTQLFGVYFLIALARMEGKDERDIAPAWPKLQKVIANQAVITPTTAQAETLTSKGETWMYVCSPDRAHLARSQGVTLEYVTPKLGTAAFAIGMAPIQGAKNQTAAQAIINDMIGKAVQTRVTTEGAVAPVSKEIELTPDLKKRLGFSPDEPMPELKLSDVEAINRQIDKWTERFNEIASR